MRHKRQKWDWQRNRVTITICSLWPETYLHINCSQTFWPWFQIIPPIRCNKYDFRRLYSHEVKTGKDIRIWLRNLKAPLLPFSAPGVPWQLCEAPRQSQNGTTEVRYSAPAVQMMCVRNWVCPASRTRPIAIQFQLSSNFLWINTGINLKQCISITQ